MTGFHETPWQLLRPGYPTLDQAEAALTEPEVRHVTLEPLPACPHGQRGLCRTCDADAWCRLHGFRVCSCWWAELDVRGAF